MSALFEVRAPAEESEGTRSQVLRWLKAPGERVVANEPLVELETDKVTVEIPAPVGGVLREILKGEGVEVAAGDLLGHIELDVTSAAAPVTQAPQRDPGGSVTREESARSAREQLSPAVRRLMSEHGLSLDQVCGSGQAGRITAADVLQAVEARNNQPTAAPAAGSSAGGVAAASVRTRTCASASPHTWCRACCIPRRT